jgi:hypothetical protein
MCAATRGGVTLPKDMAWREANHTKMKGSACENKKNGSKALPRLPQRWGGGEIPSESESLGDNEEDEDNVEGDIIFPCSLLHENLPSPGDLFGQPMGAPVQEGPSLVLPPFIYPVRVWC